MASDQAKWLATLSSIVVGLSLVLLRLELAKLETATWTRSDGRCAFFAFGSILLALGSTVAGSIVQGTILRYMEGAKDVRLIPAVRTERFTFF